MKAHYKTYVLFIALVMVMACKKELYKDPIGLITPEQINTDPKLNTVKQAVSSSYQLLSSTLNIIGQWAWDDGTVTRNDFILGDIASGDVQKKWNPDGDQAWMDQIANFSFTAANPAFNGQWSYDYEGIARANIAISYLTNADIVQKTGIDEGLKNRLLGEVYFLRAFYYFDLVNDFGDVPLLLTPLKSFEEAYDVAKREPKANVWAQISQDLAQAVTLLPNTKYTDDTERWRASKGAAIAMQAKVALYNQHWADVVTLVGQLEGMGFYSLNANYFDSFNLNKKFNENEVIFAYNHVTGQTPPNGNGLCALLGWGFIAPTADFVNAFEANDPRLGLTMDVGKQNIYKIMGDLNSNNKGNEDAASNKVYIRWADVLLWKAEALNELGNYPESISLINQIRTRARTSTSFDGSAAPAGTLPDRPASTDKAQIKNWIIQERRVELGFESQRFNDLKRWQLAESVLKSLGKNFQPDNYLYPIPQGEVDKSAGSITQNNGY